MTIQARIGILKTTRQGRFHHGFGHIDFAERKQAGLTIDELSARSGVPKGTLNKILNGITRDPQLETVKALARALGCTLEDFDDTPRPRTLTQPEFDLIRKYRRLDSDSRRLVDLVIDQELRRGQTDD